MTRERLNARGAAHLAADRHHGHLRHPLDSGSGLPIDARRGHEPASGSHHERRRDRPCPATQRADARDRALLRAGDRGAREPARPARRRRGSAVATCRREGVASGDGRQPARRRPGASGRLARPRLVANGAIALPAAARRVRGRHRHLGESRPAARAGASSRRPARSCDAGLENIEPLRRSALATVLRGDRRPGDRHHRPACSWPSRLRAGSRARDVLLPIGIASERHPDHRRRADPQQLVRRAQPAVAR